MESCNDHLVPWRDAARIISGIRPLGPLQPGIGLSGGKPYRMSGGDMIVTGETMPEPTDEDTSKIDIELIARDLEAVAKLAGNLNQTDIATEIGALVAKYRDQAKAIEG